MSGLRRPPPPGPWATAPPGRRRPSRPRASRPPGACPRASHPHATPRVALHPPGRPPPPPRRFRASHPGTLRGRWPSPGPPHAASPAPPGLRPGRPTPPSAHGPHCHPPAPRGRLLAHAGQAPREPLLPGARLLRAPAAAGTRGRGAPPSAPRCTPKAARAGTSPASPACPHGAPSGAWPTPRRRRTGP